MPNFSVSPLIEVKHRKVTLGIPDGKDPSGKDKKKKVRLKNAEAAVVPLDHTGFEALSQAYSEEGGEHYIMERLVKQLDTDAMNKVRSAGAAAVKGPGEEALAQQALLKIMNDPSLLAQAQGKSMDEIKATIAAPIIAELRAGGVSTKISDMIIPDDAPFDPHSEDEEDDSIVA